MGWDIWAEIDTGEELPAQVGEPFNYTYNTNPMLDDVGIDWYDLTGKVMLEVLPVLESGIAKLKAAPEKYRAMNPENGCGSYETLVPKLEEIVAEFRKHPKARLGSCL